MRFCLDSHVTLRMNCNNFSPFLTFPLPDQLQLYLEFSRLLIAIWNVGISTYTAHAKQKDVSVVAVGMLPMLTCNPNAVWQSCKRGCAASVVGMLLLILGIKWHPCHLLSMRCCYCGAGCWVNSDPNCLDTEKNRPVSCLPPAAGRGRMR